MITRLDMIDSRVDYRTTTKGPLRKWQVAQLEAVRWLGFLISYDKAHQITKPSRLIGAHSSSTTSTYAERRPE